MQQVKSLFLVLAVLCSGFVKATHNRAGEIIYKRIEPFSKIVGGVSIPVYHYSITVIKYTDHEPNKVADRCEDTVAFGDNEKGLAPRINNTTINCNCGFLNNKKIGCGDLIINESTHKVKLNIYTITHYYPGPGTYYIRSLDPNRNADVVNMHNSVNVPFYIESMLIINAHSGANSSPVFAYTPIDKACLGQCFEHNPGAYDPDPDDSLSFELSVSLSAPSTPVPGYSYPEGNYSINPVTGELRWCSPTKVGEYNLAFVVKEWRKNTNNQWQLIGSVMRDMQVIVENCPNKQPPQVRVPADTCVEAGTLISANLFVSDADKNRVTVSGGGGPFLAVDPKASLSNTEGSTDNAQNGFNTIFTWQTSCDHVRNQPYIATIKVQDNDFPVKQVSFSSFSIRVLPPGIKNISATPAGSSIRVEWSPPPCLPAGNMLQRYLVFRRNTCDSLSFSPCGFDPELNGYELIARVGTDTTFFNDDNNKNGLVVGQNYNYVVIGEYADGTRTYAGAGVCSELKRDVPILLNVDVRSTSSANGSIYTRWARPVKSPDDFDSLALPGPYIFRLIHKAPGAAAALVFSTTAQYLFQLDTEYVHQGINTASGPHEYQIEFIAGETEVGSSQKAQSVFLHAEGGDKKVFLSWSARTPWENHEYRIYRQEPGATGFSVIATAADTLFTDTLNIRNGLSYCYRIESEGAYSDPAIFKPLINFSQDSCVIPWDNTPPCSPTITLDADCPGGYVRISWTDASKECSESGDVSHYQLFHKRTINDEYMLIDEGSFIEYERSGLEQVSGCYAVQALDTNGNRSEFSLPFCIDNCPVFELPNIFTPNGDGANDFFQAVRVRQIVEINLIVVDRWGNQVYQTTDPYFKWDGVSSITNVAGSEGTYFYICDVYEPRLKGIVKRTLRGPVTLQR